jgi:hypothetical protein
MWQLSWRKNNAFVQSFAYSYHRRVKEKKSEAIQV